LIECKKRGISKLEKSTKRCLNCILPAVNDRVILDDKGICNICNTRKKVSENNTFYGDWGPEKLKSDIDKYKTKDGKYDCIIGVSGGKDSLMTLYIAKKELGLNPLAVFIDNGFGLDEMYENIHNATNTLDVDLIVYRTNELKEIFKTLLITKKPIYYCRICHELIDVYLREIATKFGIQLLLGGYTKGQEYARSDELFWIYNISDKNTIQELSKNQKYSHIIEILSNHAMFLYENYDHIVQINPFLYMDYEEEKIIEFLKREMKFKVPKDSWPKDSTNCLFNFVSQHLARKNFGYSQHEAELSTLVREGELTRQRALDIIETPLPQESVDKALSIVGLEYKEII
jgi:tRNA(Ile)-lysidine synthase TilS/MesJ